MAQVPLPLHEAVRLRQVDETREILNANKGWSSVNLLDMFLTGTMGIMMKTDNRGMCAIHVAAELGDCDIIKLFLSFNPKFVNIRSKDYKTALHIAIEHNKLEVVKELLDNQRRLPLRGRKMVSHHHDKDGNTAFHIAAINKVQPQIVRELLRWPLINVNTINREGLTALDIALHNASVEAPSNSATITEILKDVGGCLSNSMQLEDRESKTVEVETLVASLIATITFGAILQVPGGIDSSTGAAKRALNPYFKVFLFFDILAFFTSLTVIVAWLFKKRLQIGISVDRSQLQIDKPLQQYLSALCLGISVACTGMAFLWAAYVVVIPPHLKENIKPERKKEYEEYKGLSNMIITLVVLHMAISLSVGCSIIMINILDRRLTNPRRRDYY